MQEDPPEIVTISYPMEAYTYHSDGKKKIKNFGSGTGGIRRTFVCKVRKQQKASGVKDENVLCNAKKLVEMHEDGSPDTVCSDSPKKYLSQHLFDSADVPFRLNMLVNTTIRLMFQQERN